MCLLFLRSAAFAETLTLSFIGDCSIGQAIQFEGYEGSYTEVLDAQGFDWAVLAGVSHSGGG